MVIVSVAMGVLFLGGMSPKLFFGMGAKRRLGSVRLVHLEEKPLPDSVPYAQPLAYKIAGVWGNHEGSLLLWCLSRRPSRSGSGTSVNGPPDR